MNAKEENSRHDDGAFYPDGLTGDAIEVLLREVEGHWSTAARPTAALLDGSAALRRERREARRAIGAVIRALPRPAPHAVPNWEVA